jgi:hypothetical protein
MASDANVLYSSTLSAAELAAVDVFVHRVVHLRCVKGVSGYAEETLIADQCWWPEVPPAWALKSALAGEPGSCWCPIVTPSLLDR